MEYLPLLLALLILSAFFSSAETAFLSLQRVRLEHYVQEGRTGAAAVSRLLQAPARLLSAVLVGNNLVNTGAAVVGALIAQRLVAGGLGALLAALAVTVLLVLFGEVGPKTLALRHNYRLSALYALPMHAWTRLMAPVSAGLDLLTRALVTVSGGEREPGAEFTEAELRTMIGLSAEYGSVAAEEARLLDRVFHFGDRQVHEVMVPRTEVVWLEKDSTLADFYRVYARAPHSRFPVFEENPDHVVGILGIKDVLAAAAQGQISPESGIAPLVRPAYFVPETKLIRDLFREMQISGTQMAVAVDEFGGTAGIVTLELLLEEMFGPVRDELRQAEREIQTIDEHTFRVDGSLSVEEARQELGIEIPEGPYDTIAGYVLSRLGHIPVEGEQLIVDDLRIVVAEMKGPKIEQLTVTRQ